MNRVYNYSLDPCGPVYITIGDGGNIEKVDVEFADDPGKCPKQTDNKPEIGGVCHMNFSAGPAKGKFCWDKQPDWSAFRDSSFGHGILEVLPKALCTHTFVVAIELAASMWLEKNFYIFLFFWVKFGGAMHKDRLLPVSFSMHDYI
jgi:Iron/zinc purple acid phosphatase-like protein C